MGNVSTKSETQPKIIFSDLFDADEINNLKIKLENKKITYDNIVFAGGGLKGISELGLVLLLKKMIDMHIINEPDNDHDVCDFTGFAGTSFGSIMATLLAVGYTTDELCELVFSLDFVQFEDKNAYIIGDIYNITHNYGICKGKVLEDKIGEFIQAKTGNSEYTFKQLYDERKKKLVTVGTDMNLMEPVYFSHLTFPDLPIKIAVRISASLPFFYQPKIITEVMDGKTQQKIYIDGGVLDNYPIHVFDTENFGSLYFSTKHKINHHINNNIYNKQTIGVRIMNKQYESLTNKKYELHNIPIDGLQSYMMSFVNVYLYGQDRCQMIDGYWERTVAIETEYLPVTQLNISDETKKALIGDGIKGGIEYFSNL